MLAVVLVFFAVTITLRARRHEPGNEGLLAWDVRFAYLPAAEAVLDGDSPYPALDDPILEDQKGYVYPPQLLLALVPLTPLPNGVVGRDRRRRPASRCCCCTLRILEVRDVRCYAAALLWVPSVSGVLLGNISIPLAFATAVAWRYRDPVWQPALALGLAISAKFLMWPLLVWTLATRRLARDRVGAGDRPRGHARRVGCHRLRRAQGLSGSLRGSRTSSRDRSYSIVGIAATAGLGEGVGQALTLLVGGGSLVGCVVFARRADDARSFTCAVAATLALSPIVWLHYLVVLLVPMAIARPRFSLLWLLPVLLWVSPRPGYAEGVRRPSLPPSPPVILARECSWLGLRRRRPQAARRALHDALTVPSMSPARIASVPAD